MRKIAVNVIQSVKPHAQDRMQMIVMNVYMLKMENTVCLNAHIQNIQKMVFVSIVTKRVMDVKALEMLSQMMGVYNVIMPSSIQTQRFKNVLKRMQHVQVGKLYYKNIQHRFIHF